MSTKSNNNGDINDKKTSRVSRRKRGLEPEDGETETVNKPSSAKKQKQQKMTSEDINNLRMFMTTMQSDIESKIGTSQMAIERTINELSATVNKEVQDLKTSFNGLQTKVCTEIDALNSQVKDHNQRLDNNTDDINRMKFSADLRLNGIPYDKNENLIELFHKIASTIGYNSSINQNVPLLKRMPIRNKITGTMVESSIITFHFATIQHKQQFYSLYLKNMPLKPENIGLRKELKIIIGENLTRTNAQIFKYAKNFKKEKKIEQLFTADGLVKIKFGKGPSQRAHTIRNTSQLDALINENEQMKQKQAASDTMEMDTSINSNGEVTNSTTNKQPNSVVNTSQQPEQQTATEIEKQQANKSNAHEQNQPTIQQQQQPPVEHIDALTGD